jgi:uncharacterized Tic20 family protein
LSISDEINRLEQLRAQGSLTDDEFAQAKRRVLDGETNVESVDGTGQLFGISEKIWCVLMHLSQLSFITGVGIILPILMWAISKDESELARRHGARMMNWTISFIVYAAVAGVLCWFLIGIPILIVLAILNVVFPIMAAVKCLDEEIWSYPMAIRIFDEE